MKNILSKFLLALALIFSTTIFCSNVFAETNGEFTYEDYLKGISEGWIGEDVSYEMLLEIQKESKELEKELDNNKNFYKVPFKGYLRPGDIIVTSSTSSAGLTGHAAIAIGDDTILHIVGFGKVPDTSSINEFRNDYKNGWIYVYRPIDSYVGAKAAQWASDTYRYSNAKYMITTNLKSTDVTYCSKIVWQGYYFGAGSNSVYNTNTLRIVKPYDLQYDEIRSIEFIGRLTEN